MKTIVSVQEFSEFEIKPIEGMAQWHDLVVAEIARRWAEHSCWIRVDCPCCNRKDTNFAFEHYGFVYVECPVCGSLFASFRPSEDDMWAWYRESAPARFWREQILPASEKARNEKIVRPRADWVLDGIAEYVPFARHLVDISPNGRGLVDLLAEKNTGLIEMVAAGMTSDLEGISTSRVRIQPVRVADLTSLGPMEVIVAIDAFDRASDMGALVGAFKNLLTPGGILFATTPVASGFEVQTLWERSTTVIPPDKLNLPTVEGLQVLFAGPTWEILELSTPGMFDVEMVRRAIVAEPDAPWPRVVRALVERTDTAGRTSLIEFLQSRRLTAFARLVVRRKI